MPSVVGGGLSEATLATLGPNVCRALTEKSYDTKKKGSKEIEKIIEFFQEKDIDLAINKTNNFIKLLVDDFLQSPTRDLQIGGLVGLVGVARGLKVYTYTFTDCIDLFSCIVCFISSISGEYAYPLTPHCDTSH